MYQVFGRTIRKTIFKVFDIFLMFIIIFYKFFFKIIVHKNSIKSIFNFVKFYSVVSKDSGINPKGN